MALHARRLFNLFIVRDGLYVPVTIRAGKAAVLFVLIGVMTSITVFS